MNSSDSMTGPILASEPGQRRTLLRKSHRSRNAPSHRTTIIMAVHAAPVGCLPPPGASPAAGERRPGRGHRTRVDQSSAVRRTVGNPTRRTEATSVHDRRAATLTPVPRRRTLRLRTRVTLFFAFIALLAGIVLLGVTYGFARNDLLDDELASARTQAFRNADLVRTQLTVDPNAIGVFFDDELRTESGGFAVLSYDDPTRARPVTDLRHPISDFPDRLVDAVLAGRTASQNASIDGSDYVTVGVYIAEYDAGYFEAFPLEDTEATLTAILTALTLGAAGTMLLATLFGLATSRSLLRPRHAPRARIRPRPRPAGGVLQRDGRRRPDADRTGGALRVRREPRAAVSHHRPHGCGRGARRPARRHPRTHPAGARRGGRPGPSLRHHGDRPARARPARRRRHGPEHRVPRPRRPVTARRIPVR